MNTLDYQRILHEIKNSATLINSSMQLLNKKCPQLQSESYWNNICQEITYLKNIVLEISYAGNLTQSRKEPVDLHSILQDTCKTVQDTFPNIDFTFHLCDNLPNISGDVTKLRQAILNLIKNATEADSASITITTESEPSLVRMIIADSGTGIPADLEDKVFDLFTTTKKQGTGLGLAITKQIIEYHGGTLLLKNHPGKGCTFTICIPVAK